MTQTQKPLLTEATYTDKTTGRVLPIYRGVLADGRALCVTADLLQAQHPTFPTGSEYTAEYWRAVAIEGEHCWIAAICEACGEEFRPMDGYYEDEHEPMYSYCAACCHW